MNLLQETLWLYFRKLTTTPIRWARSGDWNKLTAVANAFSLSCFQAREIGGTDTRITVAELTKLVLATYATTVSDFDSNRSRRLKSAKLIPKNAIIIRPQVDGSEIREMDVTVAYPS